MTGRVRGEGSRLVSRIVLTLCVFLFTGMISSGSTGAWFLDYGQWLDGHYRMGFINYDVEINGSDIGIQRDGQEIGIIVPIQGGVKIDDSSDAADLTDGREIEAHAEENFNEGVTPLQIRFTNTGDLPLYLDVTPDAVALEQLANQGILCVALPDGAIIDPENRTVQKSSEAAVKSYKQYIWDELQQAGGWSPGNYAQLAAAAAQYRNRQGGGVEAANALKPGAEYSYTVHFLVFAEYDAWTGKANASAAGVQSAEGAVKLTVTASPTRSES